MAGIDKDLPFVAVNIAVLTISDSRTEANDTSGDLLESRARDAGHNVAKREIVKDDAEAIVAALAAAIADPGIDVVISTGGTGVTGRDVTPEAVKSVIEKEITGFGELFRSISLESVGTSAIQSRAIAGMAGSTFIFALPGSTGACRDGWDGILKYQLDIRHKPCNFVELLPRLTER